jgi:hypothetical protein
MITDNEERKLRIAKWGRRMVPSLLAGTFIGAGFMIKSLESYLMNNNAEALSYCAGGLATYATTLKYNFYINRRYLLSRNKKGKGRSNQDEKHS